MASLGVDEGDILSVTGKRRAVAKCAILENKSSEDSAWMTATVRNNAEVPLDGVVEISKSQSRPVDAAKLVLLSAHRTEISDNFEQLRIAETLTMMTAGLPVLNDDYLVSFHMGGGLIVFQVLQADPAEAAAGSESPLIITKNTKVEVVRDADEKETRRSYPLFWISFQETVRKNDVDNIFLVMTFYGLHYGGHISGEIQKKITKETDIQSLSLQFREAGQRTMDLLNEESRTKEISADQARNRILQSWVSV